MGDKNVERTSADAARVADNRALSNPNRTPGSGDHFRTALDRARENNDHETRRYDARRDNRLLDNRRAEANDRRRAENNESARKEVERDKQNDKPGNTRSADRKQLQGNAERPGRVSRDGKSKGDGFGGSSDQKQDEKKKELRSNKEVDPSRQAFNISHMLLQPGMQNPQPQQAPAHNPGVRVAAHLETAALLERFVQSVRVGQVGKDGTEIHLRIRAGSAGNSGIEIRLRKQGNLLLAVLRADSDSLPEAERLAENFRAQAKERGLDFDAIDVEMV